MDGSGEGVLADLSGNWLELLVSELVHLRPNAQARQHLVDLMRRCQSVKPTVQGGGNADPQGSEVLQLIGNLIEVGRGEVGQRLRYGSA